VSVIEGQIGEFKGLLQVTFSHRIPTNFTSTLFLERTSSHKKEFDSNTESRILTELKDLFSDDRRKPGFELRTLDELASELKIRKVDQYRSGSYVFDSYGYEFARHFLDGVPSSEQEASLPYMINVYIDEKEYPREFAIINSQRLSKFDHEFRTAFHLLCVLGYRRSELFTSDFHLRLLNIALPPGVVSINGNLANSYVVVPIMILHRLTRSAGFTRIVTINLVMIPRDMSRSEHGQTRKITSAEIESFRDEVTSFSQEKREKMRLDVQGPLREYLALDAEVAFDELADMLLGTVYAQLTSNTGDPLSVASSRAYSSLVAADLLVNWDLPAGEAFPWQDWLHGKPDRNLEEQAFEILRFSDSHSRSPHTVAGALDLHSLCTNDENGLDVDVLQFYDPQKFLRLFLQHESYETALTKGLLWSTLGWYLFTNVSVSLLREIVRTFHYEMESKQDLKSLLSVSHEFLDVIDDFYDLAVRQVVLKMNYEKVRHISGLDKDYKNLREAVQALESDMSLDSSYRLNKLVFAFAVANVVSLFFIASDASLSVLAIVVGGGVIVTIFGALSYFAYERMEAAAIRFYRSLKRIGS
jgi:hypothetical protein